MLFESETENFQQSVGIESNIFQIVFYENAIFNS